VTRLRRGPKGSPRRRLAPVLIGVLVLASFACVPAAGADPAAGVEAPFCHQRYVRDYQAPLREMPRPHPPPEGELPFGPRNFGIHRIDRTPAVLEGSRFGYRFGGKHEGTRVLDLGWRAVAVAWSVDRRGRRRGLLGKRRWQVERIKDLDALEIAFPADHPGFFRIDLRIVARQGLRHVGYRDYFRVLRRSNEVSIGVSAATVHPGESIWARLENAGAGQLSSPGYLNLERAEGEAWVPISIPPTPRSVMGVRWLLGPGEIAWCQRLDVPADAAPGSYRFSTPINLANTGNQTTATGSFLVVP
jgi:hypothetical protein